MQNFIETKFGSKQVLHEGAWKCDWYIFFTTSTNLKLFLLHFVISDQYEINRIEIYFIINRRARRSVRAARGAADRGLRHISQESPRARGRGANFKLVASCLSMFQRKW